MWSGLTIPSGYAHGQVGKWRRGIELTKALVCFSYSFFFFFTEEIPLLLWRGTLPVFLWEPRELMIFQRGLKMPSHHWILAFHKLSELSNAIKYHILIFNINGCFKVLVSL